jgi:hypothetical protein
VECFGLLGDDDIDCLTFFLLLGQLPSEGDDVGSQGDPSPIEGLHCVGPLLGHDLAPLGA